MLGPVRAPLGHLGHLGSLRVVHDLIAGTSRGLARVGAVLRERLGDAASRVPAQEIPDEMIRQAARTDPDLGALLVTLGHRRIRSSEKARRLLGWAPGPAEDAVEASGRALSLRAP